MIFFVDSSNHQTETVSLVSRVSTPSANQHSLELPFESQRLVSLKSCRSWH